MSLCWSARSRRITEIRKSDDCAVCFRKWTRYSGQVDDFAQQGVGCSAGTSNIAESHQLP